MDPRPIVRPNRALARARYVVPGAGFRKPSSVGVPPRTGPVLSGVSFFPCGLSGPASWLGPDHQDRRHGLPLQRSSTSAHWRTACHPLLFLQIPTDPVRSVAIPWLLGSTLLVFFPVQIITSCRKPSSAIALACRGWHSDFSRCAVLRESDVGGVRPGRTRGLAKTARPRQFAPLQEKSRALIHACKMNASRDLGRQCLMPCADPICVDSRALTLLRSASS